MRYKIAFGLFALVVTIAAGAGHPARAGLVSALLKGAEHAAVKAGKHADDLLPGIEDAARMARRLPDATDASRLALVPGEGKTWKLVPHEGEAISLSSLDDLNHSFDDIHFSSKNGPSKSGVKTRDAKAARRNLYHVAVREEDFFKLRDQIGDLPDGVTLQLMRRSGKAYPLAAVMEDGASRLMIRLNGNILLNPATAHALDANIDFLRRGINRSDLKIGSFGKTSPKTAAKRTDRVISLDAGLLDASLARMKNRTLMITGKIHMDAATSLNSLAVKEGKTIRNIPLASLEQAAQRQRVNLILVDSTSSLQPGKSWFSKTGMEKRFAAAQQSVTQQDLLEAMAPSKADIVINASEGGKNRIMMATRYRPGNKIASPASAAGTGDYSLKGWLLDASFRAGLHQVRASVEDPSYTREMESRWLPWVSNMALIGSIIAIVAFLAISAQTWHWWMAIWGLFLPNGQALSPLTRGIRLITFLPFALLAFTPALFWLAIKDWFLFFTWPFRKLFGWAR